MIALMVFVLLRAGAVHADWSVIFKNPDICAAKGSSVKLSCSYNYDFGNVNKVSWFKGELQDKIWKRVKLANLPAYENRFEYVGDLQHDCSLALHDLQLNDSGYYYFQFDTEGYGWRSKTSVYLSVTELMATVNRDTVQAGDNVALECKTSCELNSTVWFKNGHQITKPNFQIQAKDSGNYFCALEGQESIHSNPVALDVQYPPLNVSVDVSYRSSLTANISVNLTCSSFANPVAENYTWYKRTTSPSSSFRLLQVGSGQVLSFPTVQESHNGLYVCQARNTLGETNSTGVMLDMNSSTLTSLNQMFLRVGIGLKGLIVLALTIVIIWVWKKRPKSGMEKRRMIMIMINIAACNGS